MKMDLHVIRRLSVPLAVGVIALVALAAVFWLNRSPKLPAIDALPGAGAGATAGVQPGGAGAASGPSVAPAAIKGQGDLAFVWHGLLYALDGETGSLQQLTDSGQAVCPTWSSDGQWVAFVRVTDAVATTGSLWIVRRDGSQAHQIQQLPGPVDKDGFAWSPTADMLAVTSDNALWLVTPDQAPRQLAKNDAQIWFAWSPDGQSLAYNTTGPDDQSDPLVTLSLAGGEPITRTTVSQAAIHVAAWWPDGKGLLYYVVPLHSASLAADGLPLCSLSLASGEVKTISTGLPHGDWLSLSPQGRLAMVAGSGRTVWNQKSLLTACWSTGSTKRLTPPKGSVAIDPAFSPDGSWLAFVATRDLGRDLMGFKTPDALADWVSTRTLWVSAADGTQQRQLTAAGTGVYLLGWSRDGSRLLFVRGGAVWLMDAAGGEPQQVIGRLPDEKDYFGFYGYACYHDEVAWYRR